MFARRRSATRSRTLGQLVELLEFRGLLSASIPEVVSLSQGEGTVLPLLGRSLDEAVQVVQLQRESAEDTSVGLSFDELPLAVREAVGLRFPGATVLAAEHEPADVIPQFDVSLDWLGRRYESSLSPSGEVLETHQILSPAELPDVLQDWVARTFPGAEIKRAEGALSSATYQIELVTETLELLEATIELPSEQPPSATQPPSDRLQTSDIARQPASFGSTLTLHQTVADFVSRTACELPSRPDPSPALGVPVADDTESAADRVVHWDRIVAAVELARQTAVTSPAVVIDDRVVPPISETLNLNDVLPFDMTAMEQALRQFLSDVESLLPNPPTAEVVWRWSAPLVAGASLLFVMQHWLIAHRGRLQPALATSARRSTWSWMLNLSTEAVKRRSQP